VRKCVCVCVPLTDRNGERDNNRKMMKTRRRKSRRSVVSKPNKFGHDETSVKRNQGNIIENRSKLALATRF